MYSLPPTFVINLSERLDRYNHIQQQFRNWFTPVERISAVRMMPGWKGCIASHLKCIQLAKERDYPWVLIVEDDCLLMEDGKRTFRDLLPFLWLNKARWDIFNGGLTWINDTSVIDIEKRLFQTKGFQTHFYLIHKKAYDSVLNGHSLESAIPIDVFYRDNLRTWTTEPYIAKQMPGASDIVCANADYLVQYNDAEEILSNMLATATATATPAP